jgi:DNA polymerase-3 subunit epsilon
MNPTIPSDSEAAELARLLETHPGYRVLRKLVPRQSFLEAAPGRRLQKGVVLDTETTGLSAESDKIIELGMVIFEFDPEFGTVHKIVSVFDELEDPGRPIPAETTAVHHITDDMVKGKRIDDSVVEALLKDVSVVIAHNASFDRPFVESRWPVFETKQWACSIKDIDWKAEGMGSAKLEYLLQTLGIFYDAHRAETDCWALLELLNAVLPQSQQPALLRLLETLNQPQLRLYALGSPFDSKDMLKARGYRWDAEKRSWHRNLSGDKALEEEIDWLKRKVYTARKTHVVQIESLGGTVRHSSRQGELVMREI